LSTSKQEKAYQNERLAHLKAKKIYPGCRLSRMINKTTDLRLKIENEKILLSTTFGPRSVPGLTSDQEEMLSLFMKSYSIREVVEHFFAKRQLVSFLSLYDLVIKLLKQKVIANISLQEYFLGPVKTGTGPGIFDRLAEKIVEMGTTKKEDKNKIKEIPFFRSLSPELLEVFLKNSSVVPVASGVTFCQEGAKTRSLLVLLSGQASVYKRDAKGNLAKVVVLTEGSLFGEAGFFFGTDRSATVVADKDCQVLVIKYVPEVYDSMIKSDTAKQLQSRIWTIHALLKADMFRSLPPECFDAVIFAGVLKSFPPNAIICKQGELGDTFYVLIQGKVSVVKDLSVVSRLEQGDCFGELALMINQGKRMASIHTETDGSVLEIPRTQFYKLLSENLLLACEFEKMAVERTRQNEKKGI
jgi:CRP-like cAMP-binding protein